MQHQQSLWKDIRQTLSSIFGAVVAAARTTEKAVALVENEVDNLNELQQMRLDQSKAERKQQNAALAQLSAPKAKKAA